MGLIRDIATQGMSRLVDSNKRAGDTDTGGASSDDPGAPGYTPPKRGQDTGGGSFGQDVLSSLRKRASRKRE